MGEKNEKKPVRPLLKAMEVGQSEAWDIERYNVILKECSMLRLEGLEFGTKMDRASRTITVTRIS